MREGIVRVRRGEDRALQLRRRVQLRSRLQLRRRLQLPEWHVATPEGKEREARPRLGVRLPLARLLGVFVMQGRHLVRHDQRVFDLKSCR